METLPLNANGRVAEVQASPRGGCHAPVSSFVAWVLALALNGLAGCSTLPKSGDPVAWWHQLQGGVIAQQRPPPPGADLPYPNLGQVPPKPPATDPTTRQHIASALIQDRTDAEYLAKLAPITLPAPPPPVPKPAPADPDASSASLEATEAPPAKAPPKAALPVGPAATNAYVDGPVPDVPDAPPPPPVLPGIAVGPTTPVPPPKPPPTTSARAQMSDAARAPVPVAFPPGSAAMPAGAEQPLKRLATQRAGGAIRVEGFGEATDTEPQVQVAGLNLALARAHAVAAALIAAGVPATALRIAAQASGQGADARLIE